MVSNRGALPEVVGDSGIIVSEINPKLIADKIREVLENFPNVNKKAIKRAKMFTFELRRKKLLEEVDSVLSL